MSNVKKGLFILLTNLDRKLMPAIFIVAFVIAMMIMLGFLSYTGVQLGSLGEAAKEALLKAAAK